MPFCTQCGLEVGVQDAFCGQCGAAQKEGKARAKTAGGGAPGQEFLAGMSPKTASMLCYVPFIGWIAAIVFLAADRFRGDRTVRFHAFQGLYLYAAYLLVDWFVTPLLDFSQGTIFVARAMKVSIFGVSVFMLVQTGHDRLFRLPFLSDLADRSVSEQK